MLKKNKTLKICAGASAGGHMNELLRLLDVSQGWPQSTSLYVTTLDVLAGKLAQKGPVYIVGECNRWHPLKAIRVLVKSLKIVIKERPDVVITTGSLPLAVFCMCAKLFGARIVWIDSVANIERFSLSGRVSLLFADLFLTQWPELAKEHRNAEYAGMII